MLWRRVCSLRICLLFWLLNVRKYCKKLNCEPQCDIFIYYYLCNTYKLPANLTDFSFVDFFYLMTITERIYLCSLVLKKWYNLLVTSYYACASYYVYYNLLVKLRVCVFFPTPSAFLNSVIVVARNNDPTISPTLKETTGDCNQWPAFYEEALTTYMGTMETSRLVRRQCVYMLDI